MTDNVSCTTIHNNDTVENSILDSNNKDETESAIFNTPKKKNRSRTRTRKRIKQNSTPKTNEEHIENNQDEKTNDYKHLSPESGEEKIQPYSGNNRGRKRKLDEVMDEDDEKTAKKQPIRKITKKERIEMMLTHSKYTRGDGPVSFPKPRKKRQSVSSFLEKIKERAASIETKTYRAPQISADGNHKINEEDKIVPSESLIEISDDEEDLELVIMPPKPNPTPKDDSCETTKFRSDSENKNEDQDDTESQTEPIYVGVPDGEDDSDDENDKDSHAANQSSVAVNINPNNETEDMTDGEEHVNNYKTNDYKNSHTKQVEEQSGSSLSHIENTLDPETEFNMVSLGSGSLPSMDQEDGSIEHRHDSNDDNKNDDNNNELISKNVNTDNNDNNNNNNKVNDNRRNINNDINDNHNHDKEPMQAEDKEPRVYQDSLDKSLSIQDFHDVEAVEETPDNNDNNDKEKHVYTIQDNQFNEDNEYDQENDKYNEYDDEETSENYIDDSGEENQDYEENEEIQALKSSGSRATEEDGSYNDNEDDHEGAQEQEANSRAIRRKTAQYRRAKAKLRGSRRGGMMQLQRLHTPKKSPEKSNVSLAAEIGASSDAAANQGLFDSEDEEEFAQRHTERMKRRYTVRHSLSQDGAQSSLPEDSEVEEFSQDVIESLSMDESNSNSNSMDMQPPSSATSSQSSLQAEVEAFRTPFQRGSKKRSLLRSSNIRSSRFAEFAANVKKSQEQNAKRASPNSSPDSIVFRRKESIKKKSNKRRTSDEMNELFKNIDSMSSQNSQSSNDL